MSLYFVGLDTPKSSANSGGVLRACDVFGANGLVVSNTSVRNGKTEKGLNAPTNVYSTHNRLPVLTFDDAPKRSIFYDIPYIGIEKTKEATPLRGFQHPPRAVYWFGPEDGSLSREIKADCRDIVQIEMNPNINNGACLNLQAAVNVVLHDRVQKLQ